MCHRREVYTAGAGGMRGQGSWYPTLGAKAKTRRGWGTHFVGLACHALTCGGFGGVGQGVGEDGHDGGVFVEVSGVDFVEGVGGGVVVVEVEAAVLDGGEAGDAVIGEAGNVFAGFGGVLEDGGADGVEDLCDGAEPLAQGGLAGVVDAGGVVGAEVALDGADVVGEVGLVVSHVGGGAFGAFFFAHPGNEADGAAGVCAGGGGGGGCPHWGGHSRA